MTEGPPPLTPGDCDLRDFAFMPLDVVRLRDSDIAALSTGEEFRCAVLLWCASWHQVPAASLPDDDRVLSQLAGYGRVVTEWKKVRDGALRGWIKCGDGRLYHPVVAEKANESWRAKHRHIYGKLEDRIRKQNKRRVEIGLVPLEIPDLDTWIAMGFPLEPDLFPPECTPSNGGRPGQRQGNPRENALKGQGQGQGYVNPSGSGDSTASACASARGSPPAAAAFIEMLEQAGIDAKADDPLIARWVDAGVSREHVLAAITEARQRRAKKNSAQPINVGFVDAILADAIAARGATSSVAVAPSAEWHRTWSGIVGRGRELGAEQQDGEPDAEFKLRVFNAAGDGPWWAAHFPAMGRNGPVPIAALVGKTGSDGGRTA
ncbi:DUF1376 domain-containing protein [Paraburkholderia dioscoreae]|uniref:DUF1376 domain-containing protein n=1 Tax=Paraburkholderia dioscoreae TaxID=2604047 RepID=A0A5Q4ZEH0_9BURK|nr:DUF1376 domain-containing protein [Paraburkholderia dioscoreae]VVD29182.1 conserved protein of unknown function [Paraburkholderia dioscoreae]